MIGFGLENYGLLETAFLAVSVVWFLATNGFRKWGIFGVTVVVMNYLAVNNFVWTGLNKTQFLILMTIVVHLVPLWAYVIESGAFDKKQKKKN